MAAEIYVNVDALARCADELPPVIGRYAAQAVDRGPVTVGHWLASLDRREIDDCLARIAADRHDEESLLPWVLFSVLLANCEGLPIDQHFPVTELVRRLAWMLQLELLRREGLLVVDLTPLGLDDVSLESSDRPDNGECATVLKVGRERVQIRALPISGGG